MRTRWVRWGTAMLALTVVVGTVLATTKHPVDVTCPVCARAFKAAEFMSTNSFGGQDRDFLGHARGEQVFLFACWTCPKCLYSGYGDDFKAGAVPDAVLKTLREDRPLKSPVAIAADLENTEDIPAWVRYDLAIQTAKVRGEKPLVLAWLTLRAGQTQRFGDAGLARIGDLATRAKALVAKLPPSPPERDDYLQATWRARRLFELAASADAGLSDPDRELARVLAAYDYARRGELPDVRRVLAVLRPEGKALEGPVALVVAELAERVDREAHYLALAAASFESALTLDLVKADERVNHRYLVGELHRRVGDPAKALAWLEPLAAEAGLDAWIATWVTEAIARAKGEPAGPPAK